MNLGLYCNSGRTEHRQGHPIIMKTENILAIQKIRSGTQDRGHYQYIVPDAGGHSVNRGDDL